MNDLTAGDLQTIMVEIMTGKAPSLRSPKADRARAELRKEIAEIKAKGGSVDIPPEIAL